MAAVPGSAWIGNCRYRRTRALRTQAKSAVVDCCAGRHFSPSILDDRLYLTGYNKSANPLEVLAIDRKNGKMLWRQPMLAKEIEKVHDVSTPATATPIVDGDRIYSYFGSTKRANSCGALRCERPMPRLAAAHRLHLQETF